jgi:hypothetical protein
MAANKQRVGNSPPRSPGRPKGSPNKTTALLKEAILNAAEETGADGTGKEGLTGYCKFLATSEPKAFAQLLGKVLPTQIAGEGGGPVETITRIELVALSANGDSG